MSFEHSSDEVPLYTEDSQNPSSEIVPDNTPTRTPAIPTLENVRLSRRSLFRLSAGAATLAATASILNSEQVQAFSNSWGTKQEELNTTEEYEVAEYDAASSQASLEDYLKVRLNHKIPSDVTEANTISEALDIPQGNDIFLPNIALGQEQAIVMDPRLFELSECIKSIVPNAEVEIAIPNEAGELIQVTNIERLDEYQSSVLTNIIKSMKHAARVQSEYSKVLIEHGLEPQENRPTTLKYIKFVIHPETTLDPTSTHLDRFRFYNSPTDETVIEGAELNIVTSNGCEAEWPHLVFPGLDITDPREKLDQKGMSNQILNEAVSNLFSTDLLDNTSGIYLNKNGTAQKLGMAFKLYDLIANKLGPNEYQYTIENLSGILSKGLRERFEVLKELGIPEISPENLTKALKVIMVMRYMNTIQYQSYDGTISGNAALEDLKNRFINDPDYSLITEVISWLNDDEHDYLATLPINSATPYPRDEFVQAASVYRANSMHYNFDCTVMALNGLEMIIDGKESIVASIPDFDKSDWQAEVRVRASRDQGQTYKIFSIPSPALAARQTSVDFSVPQYVGDSEGNLYIVDMASIILQNNTIVQEGLSTIRRDFKFIN